MSSSFCLPTEAPAISATDRVPVRTAKRFTITSQPSKLNRPRITVTDSTACITSSYSYTTAQELVKELAHAVGMLVCTPDTAMEMLRAQQVLNSEVYD
ncbi:MAG TPA: hypothetical protein VMB49_06340 [Acidobacteriaceae bacterium]|nr:hypothetical protein [Acidobacteriaceae bacterium]